LAWNLISSYGEKNSLRSLQQLRQRKEFFKASQSKVIFYIVRKSKGFVNNMQDPAFASY